MTKDFIDNKSHSIFDTFIQTGHVPYGYDRMISLDIHSSGSKAATDAGPYLEFSYIIKNTDVSLKRKLPHLSDINNQDIVHWIEEFRNTATLCEWSAETAFQVLVSVVPSNLTSHILSKREVDPALDSILNLKYPRENLTQYLKELNSIRQSQFHRISQYQGAIAKTIHKLAVCKGWNKSQQTDREEEKFFEGLSRTTHIEIIKLGLTKKEEIVSYISRVEESAITNFMTRKEFISANKTHHSRPEPAVQGKWCSKHRTTKHDNTECFSQSKVEKPQSTSGNTDKPTRRTYLVKEAMQKVKALEYPGLLNEEPVMLLLDTGADSNYISESLCKKNSKIQLSPSSSIIQFANEARDKVIGKFNAEIKFRDIQHEVYFEEINVVKGLDQNIVILGLPFMNRQKIVINFSEYLVQIGQKYLTFPGDETRDLMNTPDQYLAHKIYIVQGKDKSMANTLRMIEDYKINNPTLGLISTHPVSMKLQSETPIAVKPYPIPLKLYEKMNKEIKRLLDLDIIAKSNSMYSSPTFPLIKRNGDIRLIVDYRALNKVTEKESFPFPNVLDQVRSIPKSKIFSQLDMKNGYYQVPIQQESQKYTAFSTPTGHYEFKRVPFGLVNAPRWFQRIMSDILSVLEYIRVFLDDILIFSPDEEMHAKHVQEVLSRLKFNHIAINFEKSHFFEPQVKFLGHIINEHGLKPDLGSVEEFRKKTAPKTRKQLLSVIGYINWFRPYLINLSQRMKPITDKTKNNIKFRWTKEDQEIIDKLMDEIQNPISLSNPNLNDGFSLYTDASDLGIGAVLVQNGHLIGVFSSKLTSAQENYTVSEKEFLAVIESLKHFNHFIYGSKIEIFTDHINNTFDSTVNNNRIQRWKILLSDYDYELKYYTGKENRAADFLSRCYRLGNIFEDDIYNLDEIRKNQQNTNLQNALKLKDLSVDEKDRVLIPMSMENQILLAIHEKLGHPGVETQYKSIKKYINIKNAKSKISHFIKSCDLCNLRKRGKNIRGSLKGNLCTKIPFKDISMDIYGPIFYKGEISRGNTEKIYLLTFIDRCTRWARVARLKDQSADEVVRVTKQEWLNNHTIPSTILTDQGTQFKAQIFQEALKERNIIHKQTSAYNPTGNSMSERINQTIARTIRCYRHLPIDDILAIINQALQISYHRALGASPHEVVYKFSPLDPLKRRLNSPLEESNRKSLENAKKDTIRRNKQRDENYHYKVGEKVLLKSFIRGKYDDFWEGPFTIEKVHISENSFIISNEYRRTQANLKQIKPAFIRGGDLVVPSPLAA